MNDNKFTPQQEQILLEYLNQIGIQINNLIDEVNNLKTRLNAQDNRLKRKNEYVR